MEVAPRRNRAKGLESKEAKGRLPRVADRDLHSRSTSLGHRSRTRAAVGTFAMINCQANVKFCRDIGE